MESTLDYRCYVPCLRWKQKESLALSRLPDMTKDSIAPLIDVPEIEIDPGSGRPRKTIDQLLSPFAKTVGKKWGKRPCFVDLRRLDPSQRMDSGAHPVEYVFDGMRNAKLTGLPVTGRARDNEYQRAVGKTCATDRRGCCIRVSIAESVKPGANAAITDLLKGLGVRADQAHLVLDLGAPKNFLPLDGICKIVKKALDGLPCLEEWVSLTVLATAFPATLGETGSPGALKPRNEWLLYKRLLGMLSSTGARLPTFGDYGIVYPGPRPTMDFRVIPLRASIRYTASESWYIVKGSDVKANGCKQYRGLSRLVVGSAHYAGEGFSPGDRYIWECAKGTGPTGNPAKWVEIGMNHHLARVASDVAKLSYS